MLSPLSNHPGVVVITHRTSYRHFVFIRAELSHLLRIEIMDLHILFFSFTGIAERINALGLRSGSKVLSQGSVVRWDILSMFTRNVMTSRNSGRTSLQRILKSQMQLAGPIAIKLSLEKHNKSANQSKTNVKLLIPP